MLYGLFLVIIAVYSVYGHHGTAGVMKIASNGVKEVTTLRKRGDLTFYNPGPSGSPGMSACEIPITDNDFIAALSFQDFGYDNPPRNSQFCGKCIRVYVGSKSVYVKVVDKCEACKSGDVDLSPVAFKMLAEPESGRVNSRWEITDQSNCDGNNNNNNGGGSPAPAPAASPAPSPVPYSAPVPSPVSYSAPAPVSTPGSPSPQSNAIAPSSSGSTTNAINGAQYPASSSPSGSGTNALSNYYNAQLRPFANSDAMTTKSSAYLTVVYLVVLYVMFIYA